MYELFIIQYQVVKWKMEDVPVIFSAYPPPPMSFPRERRWVRAPPPHQVPGWTLEPIIPGALLWASPFVGLFPAAQSLVPEGSPSMLGTGVGAADQEQSIWGSRPLGLCPQLPPTPRMPLGSLSLSLSPLPSDELLPCHPPLGYLMFQFTGQACVRLVW